MGSKVENVRELGKGSYSARTNVFHSRAGRRVKEVDPLELSPGDPVVENSYLKSQVLDLKVEREQLKSELSSVKSELFDLKSRSDSATDDSVQKRLDRIESAILAIGRSI